MPQGFCVKLGSVRKPNLPDSVRDGCFSKIDSYGAVRKPHLPGVWTVRLMRYKLLEMVLG